MTELRRRMDDDMLARGLADRTRESYLWAVTGLARFYHRSPDQISDEEIQAYLVHLIRDRQRSWSTCNIVVHGLRFFYHTTLKRDEAAGDVTLVNGAGTFTKTAIAVSDPAIAQRIISNPSGFYFNVHTTLNPGGAIRGTLVKVQ
jgi:Phage integrase, N-terminal SAM-like domain/CHRD domain